MPFPSLSFRRPAFLGVAGPFVAVILVITGEAAAQPGPSPSAALPAPIGLAPAPTGLAPAPMPGVPGAPTPLPGAFPSAPAPGPPGASTYDPSAPAWGPPPDPNYWPSYRPAYPPSPTFYQQEQPFSLPPPAPKEPANRNLMVVGVVASIGGVAALITGSILMSIAKERIDVYRDGPAYCCAIDDAPLRNAGITLLAIGGITATIGIPLWMIGGRRVLVRKTPGAPPPKAPAMQAPRIRVGTTGASLSWQF